MSAGRRRLASAVLALVVVTSVLTVAPVGPGAAAEQSFVVEQGSRCIPVTPLSGSQDVVNFYDYRNPYNTDGAGSHTYSSHMPSRLTQPETSRLFLYDGPRGVSLVIVHNQLNAGDDNGDSAATFRFSGLPGSGEWAVVDDRYPGQDDRVTRTRIDWTWLASRTDGGVFRGIDRPDLRIRIAPAWNENAALYDSPEQRDGRITRWQVLSGSLSNPQVTGLSLSAPITIRAGSCSGDETAPNARLSASPTEAAVGEPVTLDAQASNDDSGITEYRWDFDGDGSPDRTTSTYRVSHAYSTAGTYEPSVTAVDAAGNTDTASVAINVTDGSAPEARAEIPDTAEVGETVRVDGSASTDPDGDISEYRWNFGDGANAAGATASHAYSTAGTYNVTLTVTDSTGDADTYREEIVVVESTPTPTPEPTTTETPTPTSTPTPSPTSTPTPTPTSTPTPTPTPASTPTSSPTPSQSTGGGGWSGSTNYGSGDSSADEPTPTPEPPEMSVSADRSSNGAVEATVSNARAGESITLEPPAGTSNSGASYRTLNVSFAADGNYNFTLQSGGAPSNVPALSVDADGAKPLAYLDVAHPTANESDLANASIEFAVDKDELAAADATADSVALYRFQGGEWTELDARRVTETDEAYVFEAETPGLSAFVIGTKQPSIGVSDVAVSDSTLDHGGTVTVTATVTNRGGAAGTYTANLTAFGDVVDSRELTLEAGEERTVTFTQRFDAPGRYVLSVDGTEATVEVTGPTETSATETTTTTNAAGQPGFGVLAALVSVLGLSALARRRD